MIIKTRKSAARQQTLQFFLELIGESGATFEQNLLGSRGICTIDPENIEAILSTNFAGTIPLILSSFLSTCP